MRLSRKTWENVHQRKLFSTFALAHLHATFAITVNFELEIAIVTINPWDFTSTSRRKIQLKLSNPTKTSDQP